MSKGETDVHKKMKKDEEEEGFLLFFFSDSQQKVNDFRDSGAMWQLHSRWPSGPFWGYPLGYPPRTLP